MPRPFARSSCLVLLSLLGACAGTAAPPAATALSLTLVQLKTGPRSEPLTKEEQGKVFAGHFANMERLAREGHLLVAGPYGATKSDPTLRGLFVLDTADRLQAQRLAETDPGFAAGVFRFEYHDLATSAPLRAFLAAELAATDAATKAGRKPSPGESARPFVLLTADGEGARAALATHPAVLLLAQLDGSRTWALLDAADVDAARATLGPLIGRLGAHVFDGWFASRLLERLSSL